MSPAEALQERTVSSGGSIQPQNITRRECEPYVNERGGGWPSAGLSHMRTVGRDVIVMLSS